MMSGTYTVSDLERLLATGAIHSSAEIDPAQLQPSSIDLTLSTEAYRMPGSVLARPGERVRDLIDDLALERVDLSSEVCLARGQVYLICLRERMALGPEEEAYANSKSSTGRIDLATRVICDGTPRYDRIGLGYQGELWLEVIPRSFDVVVSVGDSLNQAIVFRGRQVLDHAALLARYEQQPLLFEADERPVAAADCLFDGRVMMTADLDGSVVGYVAKRAHKPVVLHRLAAHNPADYFTPLASPASGYLFLEKDRFYILATAERVCVPVDLACEMVPYDPAAGEFRAHYAGFFDPGWGIATAAPGARAVLEVRPHEDDLILRHRQPICAMAYERLTAVCDRPYGGATSNLAARAAYNATGGRK
ncbi:MAG: 2'-deoxycytidine 5'-triphosphate deaminase [Planctomycetota bacterium]|jgi:dCTP deaminase